MLYSEDLLLRFRPISNSLLVFISITLAENEGLTLY
jgi:hypothetical protein